MRKVYSNDYYTVIYRDKDINPFAGLIADNMKIFNGYFLGDRMVFDIQAQFKKGSLGTVREYLTNMAEQCVDKMSVEFTDGEVLPLFESCELNYLNNSISIQFKLNSFLREKMREGQESLHGGMV